MSKTIRKNLFILLACCTLSTMMTGCSSSPGENVNLETASTEEIVKPEEVSLSLNFGLTTNAGLSEWIDEFYNQTGIKLTVENLKTQEFYQNLDMRLAMNKAAEVISISEGKLPIYASDGALYDLTDLVANSETIQSLPAEVLENCMVSGKFYGIPVESGGGTITYIRKDILDQLSLKVPTTYDEFINVLRAFKNYKPGFIPYTAPGLVGDSAEMYLKDFYQDATPEFTLKDGKWVDGMSEANMVAALTRLKSAFQEGLIDVEIETNGTKAAREKWATGNVGVFNYWAGTWGGTLDANLKKSISTGIAYPMPALAEVEYSKRPPVVLAISKDAENPEGIFKYILEYVHDGAEGSLLFEHGVKGVHWELGSNNVITHLPNPSDPSKIMDKAYIASALALTPIEGYTYEIDDKVAASLNILDTYGVQKSNTPASSTLTLITAELTELRQRTVSDIMLGNVSVTDGLAAYKAEAEKLGVSKVLEEFNAAF